jgi:hypothetical protein
VNALVVYFSKFGNTQMLAEAIAEKLAGNGGVRTISSDELTANDLKDADLIVMGSPTHNMNLPKSVKPVFERLPRRVLPGTRHASSSLRYLLQDVLVVKPVYRLEEIGQEAAQTGRKARRSPRDFPRHGA